MAAAGAAEGSDDLMGTFKVANFTSNEDDSTFWSRLIQPVAEEEEAGLGQRAARCAGVFIKFCAKIDGQNSLHLYNKKKSAS